MDTNGRNGTGNNSIFAFVGREGPQGFAPTLDVPVVVILSLSKPLRAVSRSTANLCRNADRFPSDFVFQLTRQEVANLRYQIGISKKGRGGRRYHPYVFTEHGAIMAAMVLNSPRAVEMSVQVVRAFVRLREMLASNRELAQKLAELERKLEGHELRFAIFSKRSANFSIRLNRHANKSVFRSKSAGLDTPRAAATD